MIQVMYVLCDDWVVRRDDAYVFYWKSVDRQRHECKDNDPKALGVGLTKD